MSSLEGFTPTPDQIALAQARKAKRLEKKLQSEQGSHATNKIFLSRPWISLPVNHEFGPEQQRVKIMTWNVLAQTLVRRELFPTSDCLKVAQREPMLHQEILGEDADIICLQEVDRIDKLRPVLEKAGYDLCYAAGRGKKHGCLIAFKRGLYALVKQRVIYYDDEEIREHPTEHGRRGRTFNTNNIGSVVALQSKLKQNHGVLVATTHLFWHPKYTYERARQAGILVQGVLKHRSFLSLDHWPCIFAGDFNFLPDDPVYSLLVGDALIPEQEVPLSHSRVVHMSVDPAVPTSTMAITNEGASEEDVDPDRVITNARLATPDDGLLSTPELIEIFSRGARLHSAYDTGFSRLQELSNDIVTFGGRSQLPTGRLGFHEPAYTSYTYYWKTTLDYIFIIDPVDRPSYVAGLLSPHQIDDLTPGLPKGGVCGSDHVSLAAELVWDNHN